MCFVYLCLLAVPLLWMGEFVLLVHDMGLSQSLKYLFSFISLIPNPPSHSPLVQSVFRGMLVIIFLYDCDLLKVHCCSLCMHFSLRKMTFFFFLNPALCFEDLFTLLCLPLLLLFLLQFSVSIKEWIIFVIRKV